ncbi:esterase [Microbacterium hominis]|nr:esterase [Microbacterium hominis]
MTTVLEIRVVDPRLIGALCVLSIGALAFLLVRRRPAPWPLWAGVAAAAGAATAAAFALVAKLTGVFGMALPWQAVAWGAIGLAATGVAVANFWRARWGRRVVAGASIALFVLTTGLGINAYYGLNTTLASLLNIQLERPIEVPTPSPHSDSGTPLYQSWTAPADMPAVGEQGTIEIPATQSQFSARLAGIYKPPAAMTSNPPVLPLVIMMMGQPGDPDPQYIAKVLDAQAQKHGGLAPYVLVVDQLGDPDKDPACADSAMYGNVETYVTKDVVAFARTLPVQQQPGQWVIAGYSNGGGCAFKYAAEHPDVWGNLLSVSGEIVPGSEHPDETIADVFGGSSSAYDAAKPSSILTSGVVTYPHEWALFTAGENDPGYIDQARLGAAAAAAAGWQADSYVVPGAGHVGDALDGGLAEGFARLYPRLGLSAP